MLRFIERNLVLTLTEIASLLGFQFASNSLAAEHANPALDARIQGIDDDTARTETLKLDDLDIRIDLVGNIAQAMMIARFANPSDDDLEGDFSIVLPDSAVVTGYALDVDDSMIDGVLVEPQKAATVYESKVRAGVDPGLATVTRANVFSTRVFPI